MQIIPATRSRSIPGYWFLSGTRGIFIKRIAIATRRNRRAESKLHRSSIRSIQRRKGVIPAEQVEQFVIEIRAHNQWVFDLLSETRGKRRAYRTRRHYSRPNWV